MKKFSNLSTDELSQIAEFSSRKNLRKINPYVENFTYIDGLRCINSEKIFEDLSGLTIDDLIYRLREQKQLIHDEIMGGLSKHALIDINELIIDPKIYDYMYKLFLFNFDGLIVSIYIDAIMSELYKYVDKKKGFVKNKDIKIDDLLEMLNNRKIYIKIIAAIRNDIIRIGEDLNQLPMVNKDPLLYGLNDV